MIQILWSSYHSSLPWRRNQYLFLNLFFFIFYVGNHRGCFLWAHKTYISQIQCKWWYKCCNIFDGWKIDTWKTSYSIPLAASSEGDFKDLPFSASCARLTVLYKIATQYQNKGKFSNFCPSLDLWLKAYALTTELSRRQKLSIMYVWLSIIL